tara:strand:- start:37840 stop:39048 length:1209 start_codon:yes stop_codon:yes gene_type:complete
MLSDVEIPYGNYWSTPFCKWQGALQNLHAVKFASYVAQQAIEGLPVDPQQIDFAVLGTTVPQHQSFYGAPWMASMAGVGHVTGPMVMQACASGVRALFTAAAEISAGMASTALLVTADRCSNGPHMYYPEPSGPGGTGAHEDWVLDNFSCDPVGRNSMVQTAENVAQKHGISMQEQHDVVLQRYAQYQDALADDRAFQRRYMKLPFDVPRPRLDKIIAQIEGDEGVAASTEEGLAKLRAVLPDGTVTFGSQTHPADGNAGMLVTTAEHARQMSTDPNVRVRILGFGQARVGSALMPEATVPAALQALEMAGLTMAQIQAVKSHNPFAVNDIYFARETGFALEQMNNFGCSLIWGHPQGPTGTRSIIEMIEELALRGGGNGLFQGCAAGDSAMAVVISVDVTA